MRPVSRLRRITAVLSSALLLQLSLLASGTLCPMHGAPGAPGRVSATSHAAHHMIHGARHAGGPASSLGTDARPQPPAAPSGRCDTDASCDMPWTPAGCATMSVCAIALSAPTSPDLALVAPAAARVAVAEAATLPLGPTFAPELPPPRA